MKYPYSGVWVGAVPTVEEVILTLKGDVVALLCKEIFHDMPTRQTRLT